MFFAAAGWVPLMKTRTIRRMPAAGLRRQRKDRAGAFIAGVRPDGTVLETSRHEHETR